MEIGRYVFQIFLFCQSPIIRNGNTPAIVTNAWDDKASGPSNENFLAYKYDTSGPIKNAIRTKIKICQKRVSLLLGFNSRFDDTIVPRRTKLIPENAPEINPKNKP